MNALLNVLLIDDSKAVNNYNRSLIKSLNFTRVIKECNDGENAVQFLSTYLYDELFPDLIFLDLVMPGIDGLKILNEFDNLVQELHEGMKPLIVVLSDHINQEKKNLLKSFEPYVQLEKLSKPMRKEDISYLLKKYFRSEVSSLAIA